MTRTEENLILAQRFLRAHLRAMIKTIDASIEEFPEGPDGSALGGVLATLSEHSCQITILCTQAMKMIRESTPDPEQYE